MTGLRAALLRAIEKAPDFTTFGAGIVRGAVSRGVVIGLIDDVFRRAALSSKDEPLDVERRALRVLHKAYLDTRDAAKRDAIWRDIRRVDDGTMPPNKVAKLAAALSREEH